MENHIIFFGKQGNPSLNHNEVPFMKKGRLPVYTTKLILEEHSKETHIQFNTCWLSSIIPIPVEREERTG